MGFFDLVRELRTGEPSCAKAARALRILGWTCVVGGAWNAIISLLIPLDESGFSFPRSYSYLALLVLGALGALLLISARGIAGGESWGRRGAQAGIVLLFLVSAFFFLEVVPRHLRFPSGEDGMPVEFEVFTLIALAQFAVPAYFGVTYLGRLPSTGNEPGTGIGTRFRASRLRQQAFPEGTGGHASEAVYKSSPSPLGVMGTFPLLIAVPLLGMLAIQKYAGPEYGAMLFPIVLVAIFAGLALFNYLPSPFEGSRTVLKAWTGGGSIHLFHGTWPFFRLILYRDALEVRVVLHRFLIPFDKMGEIPDKVGFFSTGLLIQSDLPGVPSSIRFGGLGMKGILESVQVARRQFLRSAGSRARG